MIGNASAADFKERHPDAVVGRISGDSYLPHTDNLSHIFLTGGLADPSPHPYFEDGRLELIYCKYCPGDNGKFHWHDAITEYQIVISGAYGVREAASGKTTWFGPGDVSAIPPGVCIERLIDADTITIAVKVPSVPGDKIHCAECARACHSRQESFRE